MGVRRQVWHGVCSHPTMSNPDRAPLPSRAALTAEHQLLDLQFAQVLAAFATGERRTIAALWTGFEQAVVAHMDREEERFFPVMALAEPTAAELLLGDHRYFRRKLVELGIGNDLHVSRLENARELVEKLREHMAREATTLYRCAVDA